MGEQKKKKKRKKEGRKAKENIGSQLDVNLRRVGLVQGGREWGGGGERN